MTFEETSFRELSNLSKAIQMLSGKTGHLTKVCLTLCALKPVCDESRLSEEFLHEVGLIGLRRLES